MLKVIVNQTTVAVVAAVVVTTVTMTSATKMKTVMKVNIAYKT